MNGFHALIPKACRQNNWQLLLATVLKIRVSHPTRARTVLQEPGVRPLDCRKTTIVKIVQKASIQPQKERIPNKLAKSAPLDVIKMSWQQSLLGTTANLVRFVPEHASTALQACFPGVLVKLALLFAKIAQLEHTPLISTSHRERPTQVGLRAVPSAPGVDFLI